MCLLQSPLGAVCIRGQPLLQGLPLALQGVRQQALPLAGTPALGSELWKATEFAPWQPGDSFDIRHMSQSGADPRPHSWPRPGKEVFEEEGSGAGRWKHPRFWG